MRVCGRLFAVALAVTALVLCAVMVTDGSDAASDKTVRVFAEVNGSVVEMTGTGGSLEDAIEDAVDRAGYEVNLGPVNIISFQDQEAPSGYAWTIQQWLPPLGWSTVNFNTASANFVDGTSYFIYLAERTTTGLGVEYSSPDFEPESTAYFFIQFVEDVNVSSVTSVLTEEQRKEGFWIAGTGSNAAWAFKDACSKLGFELDMSDGVRGDVVDYNYIGWLNSFLGLSDELMSGTTEDGSWKYWSQFYWDDSTGSWIYGETLGHYDPAVVKYYGLVRQITTKDNTPVPDQDPSDVPISSINNGCTVRFIDGDGNLIKSERVAYFGAATAPSNPTKSPSGNETYVFTGWDVEFDQVIKDLTVTAQFRAESSSEPGVTTVPVTGVTVSGESSLNIGETATYVATVSPSNATNKAVSWTSSNTSVATVDSSGRVTGVSAGSAVITVTAEGGITGSMTVRVVGSTMLSLSSSFVGLQKGESVTLIAELQGGSQTITWSSDDTDVATVDSDGRVTMVSDTGSATIIASTADGLKVTCKVVAISQENVEELTSIDVTGSGSGTVVLRSELIEVVSNSGSDITITTDVGTITIAADIIGSLDSDISFGYAVVSPNSSQASLVGDSTLYSYTITSGGGSVSQLGGTLTISMPYNLPAGSDPSDVRVYCIGVSGQDLEEFDCTYSDGYVTFETPHLSAFFATDKNLLGDAPATTPSEDDDGDEGGSGTMLYIGIVAAVIVVIAAVALMLARRNA